MRVGRGPRYRGCGWLCEQGMDVGVGGQKVHSLSLETKKVESLEMVQSGVHGQWKALAGAAIESLGLQFVSERQNSIAALVPVLEMKCYPPSN